MYLILTLAAAVAATVLWRKNKGYKLDILCFIYWGASLMWLVDGIVAATEGEPFFEMTADAALLGAVVILAGLAAWAIIFFAGRKRECRQ